MSSKPPRSGRLSDLHPESLESVQSQVDREAEDWARIYEEEFRWICTASPQTLLDVGSRVRLQTDPQGHPLTYPVMVQVVRLADLEEYEECCRSLGVTWPGEGCYYEVKVIEGHL